VTQPSTATNKPITKNENRTNKNEIFVDLLERLTVLFGAGVRKKQISFFSLISVSNFFYFQGEVLRYEVDGTIQMKSYLSGNPTIKMGLNQDVQIGRSRENPGFFYFLFVFKKKNILFVFFFFFFFLKKKKKFYFFFFFFFFF